MNVPLLSGSQQGFIALISSIVIGSVLVLIATTTAIVTLTTGQSVLLEQTRLASRALAEGCTNAVLLRLQNNPDFAGNTVSLIADQTCDILPITQEANQIIVTVQTKIGQSQTTLQTTVQRQPFAVLTQTEVFD